MGRFKDGTLMLGDEVGTPDCSRYWKESEWLAEQQVQDPKKRKAPKGFDKEPVRAWGKEITTLFFDKDFIEIVGINNLDPDNSEHREFVHELDVPESLLKETSDRFHQVLEPMWGMSLPDFQRDIMGIR